MTAVYSDPALASLRRGMDAVSAAIADDIDTEAGLENVWARVIAGKLAAGEPAISTPRLTLTAVRPGVYAARTADGADLGHLTVVWTAFAVTYGAVPRRGEPLVSGDLGAVLGALREEPC